MNYRYTRIRFSVTSCVSPVVKKSHNSNRIAMVRQIITQQMKNMIFLNQHRKNNNVYRSSSENTLALSGFKAKEIRFFG